MQEKLIDILSRATAWMTAKQIADAGGWRSASNVTVALQQMEKANGQVERRKSPSETMWNGLPATEWKLTDKKIKDATESKMGRKPKHPPLESAVVRKSRTTEMPTDKECCNAAKVVATTAGAEVAELRKHIADLIAENSGFCSLIEEQRNQIAKLNEQLMHGEEAVDVKNAKLPVTLQVVPEDQWPEYPRGTSNIPYAVLRSRHFLVQCYQEHDGITRLSVARSEIDTTTGRWKDGITWDELQDIKRQVGLEDYMAVEIYPADRDIINVANMRHLWVLRDPLPFGWKKGGAA